MLIDYHIHSKFSIDGASSLDEISCRALELGICEIGFAEHVDLFPADPGFGFLDYDAYSSAIGTSQRLFAGDLAVKKGVEMDYQRSLEQEIREWLEGKKFDFVIGSVHYVDGKPIDLGTLTEDELRNLYPRYCEEVIRSVECGLFDIVGHFDLISSYCHIPVETKKTWVPTVAEKIRDAEVFLEVNARGFRKGIGDTVPGKEIISSFLEMGGRKISIGSDSHSALQIGNGLRETTSMLDELGYEPEIFSLRERSKKSVNRVTGTRDHKMQRSESI